MLQYGGASIQADPAATPSTIVQRDAAGGVVGTLVQGSEVKTTGCRTNPAPPTKTALFTADATAVSYICDATAGSYNATLPPAATCPGRVYFFLRSNSGANVPTVKGNGAELINAANTYALSAQWKWVRVESDGTQWWGMGN
jgi:hypothetical protein